MLQSTDPERLGNKKGSWRDAQISLGKGNRRDFMRVGGDGNMSDQVEVRKGRLLKESAGSVFLIGLAQCTLT